MILIVKILPKLETAKDVVRSMSKKSDFRTPFNSQHAKASQTSLKSTAPHFLVFFNSSE